MTDQKRAFIAGDPLRGIAALSVLVFHAAVFAYLAADVPAGASLGDAFGNHLGAVLGALDVGLYLFFVLSGYLVGGRFVRAWVWGEPWPRVRKYLARRARRIVPAFWLVAALVIVRHGVEGSAWHEVVALFLFAQNFDPSPLADALFIQTWTLDIEAAFYIALPAIAFVIAGVGRRLPERARLAIALVVLAAIAAVSLGVRMSVDDQRGALGRSLVALAFAFTPGMALAALEPAAVARLARASGAAGRAVALLLLGAGTAAFLVLAGIPAGEEDRRGIWFLLSSGSFVGSALVWQWSTGGAPRWLDNRPLHALGRWSYGVYLIHVAVLADLLRLLPDATTPRKALLALTLMCAVISIALAAASWRWFERPLLEEKRRLPPEAEVAP